MDISPPRHHRETISMITIVDYGVGNVQALLNMFDHLGIEAQSSKDPGAILNADKLVLPGVGSFDKAMCELNTLGLVDTLHTAVLDHKIPVLGICLGMQLFSRKSAEGSTTGLGWLAADVQRIEPPQGSQLKVPHVGWAEIDPRHSSPLLAMTGIRERFYFVHSYHVVCDEPANVLATVDYGHPLCCAIHRDNIWGVQFHPEKSHRFGMRLLSSFALLP